MTANDYCHSMSGKTSSYIWGRVNKIKRYVMRLYIKLCMCMCVMF